MCVYDGLHYDALVVLPFAGAPEELELTMYEPSSADAAAIEEGARLLVRLCCW